MCVCPRGRQATSAAVEHTGVDASEAPPLPLLFGIDAVHSGAGLLARVAEPEPDRMGGDRARQGGGGARHVGGGGLSGIEALTFFAEYTHI